MLVLNLNRLSKNIISNCHFFLSFQYIASANEGEYFQSIYTPLMQNCDLNRSTALKKSSNSFYQKIRSFMIMTLFLLPLASLFNSYVNLKF